MALTECTATCSFQDDEQNEKKVVIKFPVIHSVLKNNKLEK